LKTEKYEIYEIYHLNIP